MNRSYEQDIERLKRKTGNALERAKALTRVAETNPDKLARQVAGQVADENLARAETLRKLGQERQRQLDEGLPHPSLRKKKPR